MKDEPWLNMVLPLTPELKLTSDLKSYLSEVRSSRGADTSARPGQTRTPGDATGPLRVVTKAQPQDAFRPASAGPTAAPDPKVNVTFYLFRDQDGRDVNNLLQRAGGLVTQDRGVTARSPRSARHSLRPGSPMSPPRTTSAK